MFGILDIAEGLIDELSRTFGATRWVTVCALLLFFLAHFVLWFIWDQFWRSVLWLMGFDY